MSSPTPAPTIRRTASLVTLLFAITSVVSMARPQPTLAWDANAFSSGSEKDLIALTNRSRAAAGLKALKVSSTLTSVARWRSKDMIQRDYFSHDIPGYGQVFKKLDAKGYCYKVAGENIGWNNYPDDSATAAIHSMFMKSDGHRKNILGKAWDVIGVGAYKGSDGKKMWTVLFAARAGWGDSGSAATPTPTAKP
ncbi:MAG: CAP domain-containing protein, partial [Candidatus Limnocylindrales bacterium]